MIRRAGSYAIVTTSSTSSAGAVLSSVVVVPGAVRSENDHRRVTACRRSLARMADQRQSPAPSSPASARPLLTGEIATIANIRTPTARKTTTMMFSPVEVCWPACRLLARDFPARMHMPGCVRQPDRENVLARARRAISSRASGIASGLRPLAMTESDRLRPGRNADAGHVGSTTHPRICSSSLPIE